MTSSNIFELVENIDKSNNIYDKKYLSQIQNDPYLTENCITDNWISSDRFDCPENNLTTNKNESPPCNQINFDRFAWIDLAAGDFEWGPSIAGEGIRSKYSVPKVPTRKALLEAELQSNRIIECWFFFFYFWKWSLLRLFIIIDVVINYCHCCY